MDTGIGRIQDSFRNVLVIVILGLNPLFSSSNAEKLWPRDWGSASWTKEKSPCQMPSWPSKNQQKRPQMANKFGCQLDVGKKKTWKASRKPNLMVSEGSSVQQKTPKKRGETPKTSWESWHRNSRFGFRIAPYLLPCRPPRPSGHRKSYDVPFESGSRRPPAWVGVGMVQKVVPLPTLKWHGDMGGNPPDASDSNTNGFVWTKNWRNSVPQLQQFIYLDIIYDT